MITKIRENSHFTMAISRKEIERLRAYLLLEVDQEIPNEVKVTSFHVFLKTISFNSKSKFILPENKNGKYYFPSKQIGIYSKIFLLQDHLNEPEKKKILISNRKLKNIQNEENKANLKFAVEASKIEDTKVENLQETKIGKRQKIISALKYLQNLAHHLQNCYKVSNTTVSSQKVKSKEALLNINKDFSICSKVTKSTNNIHQFFSKKVGSIKFVNSDFDILNQISKNESKQKIMNYPSYHTDNAKLQGNNISDF